MNFKTAEIHFLRDVFATVVVVVVVVVALKRSLLSISSTAFSKAKQQVWTFWGCWG